MMVAELYAPVTHHSGTCRVCDGPCFTPTQRRLISRLASNVLRRLS